MKTKMLATLFAIATAASFGFSAAAEDTSGVSSFLASGPGASAARIQPTPSIAPDQPRPSGRFLILSDVRAAVMSSKDLVLIRGAGTNTGNGYFGTETGNAYFLRVPAGTDTGNQIWKL